jgi:ABC-type transport system involved in multi-copper enzyme maturation permease subunit
MASSVTIRRSWWREWWRYVAGIVTQVVGNPVVVRELRVRVRFARAYWLQALYLLFLILIVGLAYTSTLGSQVILDPYRAQQQLQAFYWIIFSTLISLIVLIAPGLTASAVTLERERRTLDLLLATPLSARQLLTGKLVGSFAFLVLLIALTLPASAVCVLLGGATFGEVLESYLMLALSGLTLSALALFTSAYSRSSMWAVFGGYLLCFAYLLATLPFTLLSFAAASGGVATVMGRELVAPLSVLNPFSAPVLAGLSLRVGGWEIPAWVVSLVVCLLFVRLVMTGAARRVGLYDKDVLPSFRRQLLLVAAVYTYLTTVGMATILSGAVGGPGFWSSGADVITWFLLIVSVPMVVTVLLITPIGKREEHPAVDDGLFNPLRMFAPSAAGALPYITLLWLVVVGAIVLGSQPLWRFLNLSQQSAFFAMVFYLYGIWVLLWGVARLGSALAGHHGLGVARWMSITLAVALSILPPFALTLLFGVSPLQLEVSSFLHWLWFPMPVIYFFDVASRNAPFASTLDAEALLVLVRGGLGWLVVGLLFGLIARRRRDVS